MLSSKATLDTHGEGSSYFVGWQEYQKNPYNEVHNPNGIINLGLAENQLSFDLLEAWLAKNKEVLLMEGENGAIFRELALFQDYNGLPAFKNALADFLQEFRGSTVKFNPKNIVLTAGATSANESLMFCLAERGDAFLVPTPYYPGFDRDLRWRTEVEIEPIHCFSSNGFRITMSELSKAYDRAVQRKLNVKGILITNPSNPLGTTLSREELDAVINFSMSKTLHVISDEIYSGTVFESPRFVSVKEVLLERDLERDSIWLRTHLVYGLSKDLGLPGFRVGMIYSDNDAVVAAATKMSSFGLISSQTQFLLAKLLGDREFTKRYVEENGKRIRARRDALVEVLGQVGAVGSLQGNAGLFCWVDLRRCLREQSFEAEHELWGEILMKAGVNISAGLSCHCTEPGWFRVCFGNVTDKILKEAVKRLKTFVECRGSQGTTAC